ncbi:hypothetical protein [Cylindrospermopsis raciborskii]|nr:hypothetical protein [Cylindrospermopsis raciborskii]MEB3146862.1 hypothetical protein [Cylindrospermopsis raciborskii]
MNKFELLHETLLSDCKLSPQSRTYKVWMQFNRNGTIQTVDF